jgi:hypothetical protein
MTTENKLDNKIIKNYVSKLDRFDKKKIKKFYDMLLSPCNWSVFPIKEKDKMKVRNTPDMTLINCN